MSQKETLESFLSKGLKPKIKSGKNIKVKAGSPITTSEKNMFIRYWEKLGSN